MVNSSVYMDNWGTSLITYVLEKERWDLETFDLKSLMIWMVQNKHRYLQNHIDESTIKFLLVKLKECKNRFSKKEYEQMIIFLYKSIHGEREVSYKKARKELKLLEL